jgi:AbiU2
MNKKTSEDYFETYRHALQQELVKLATYVRLFRRLHERKADRLAEMNLAPAFFSTTIDALFSAIVLWVDKLFGSRSERGILNFLGFIEQHRNLFDLKQLQRRCNYPDGHRMLRTREPITLEHIEADRDRIAKFKPLANFKLRRDKFQAHFDKEYCFNEGKLLKDAPIAWGDLEQVVQLGKELSNEYSAAYDGKVFVSEPVNAADVDHLLERLHRANPLRKKDKMPEC